MLPSRLLAAPMLLLLWQVAPLHLKTDDIGRVRISLGTGGGSFSFRDYDASPGGMSCLGPYAGTPAGTVSDSWSSSALSVEAWPRRDVRIQAVFGKATGLDPSEGYVDDHFGGAQVILEKKAFGIGLGAENSGFGSRLQPSASVRVGSLTGISLRADYGYPDVTLGLRGGPRVGIGLNQGQTRKPRVLMGISTTPIDSGRRLGAFLNVETSLGNQLRRRAGLYLHGFFGGMFKGNSPQPYHSMMIGAWVEP